LARHADNRLGARAREPRVRGAGLQVLRALRLHRAAMDRIGENADELWDETDGFFYDVLRLPSGTAVRLKLRSLVGLIPLFASTIFERDVLERLPAFAKRMHHFVEM